MEAQFLKLDAWRAHARAHHERLEPRIHETLERHARGLSHPVRDFLFTYYSHRPKPLLVWHPGVEVWLELPKDEAEWHDAWRRFPYEIKDGWVGIPLTALGEKTWHRIQFVFDLCVQILQRPPRFGCYGLHEWAMVDGLKAEEIRHSKWPLRLPPEAISKLIRERPLVCTHYDAYRFFTPSAVPLNVYCPKLETRMEMEQAGCLHANMDLYKWSYKLSPYIPSDTLAEAFELAWSAREMDMEASPYDLSELGFSSIKIETPEGRAEYETRQRAISRRGQEIRSQLMLACKHLLDHRSELATVFNSEVV